MEEVEHILCMKCICTWVSGLYSLISDCIELSDSVIINNLFIITTVFTRTDFWSDKYYIMQETLYLGTHFLLSLHKLMTEPPTAFFIRCTSSYFRCITLEILLRV